MLAKRFRSLAVALTMAASVITPKAFAESSLQTVATSKSFADLQKSLEAAVSESGMVVVTRACASCGAARRNITIPGNMVIGVFRNDFAVRMLEASIPAGIEAPIRFYLTENSDGTASLSYQLPSALFAVYGSPELDAMAKELDGIWQGIIAGATN